jgi:xylitol oxidase
MVEIAARLKNWSGNFEFSTSNVHHPESVEQVQALVKSCKKLRVIGTRHCFNRIADSSENLVSLDRMPRLIEVDSDRKQVKISANLTYGELCPVLHQAGFALHNMASLGHITVVGACSTATHGSGVRNRTLAAAVSQIDVVTASGDLVSFTRGDERFNGAVVSLGGLGVIVSLTLDLQPSYEMSQHVYERLPDNQVEANFDAIVSSAYSVSMFTTWRQDFVDQVWLKRRSDDAPLQGGLTDFFGAQPATQPIHPIAELSAESCTGQLGVSGHWYERLPHFRIDAQPSAGDELQSEFFVPRAHAAEAFRAVKSISGIFQPYIMVSEIRTVAADDFWMSPYYQRDSVGFHTTWKRDVPAVMKIVPQIEAQLAPFAVRPHWGKLFTVAPETLHAAYEKLPQFQALLRDYDPEGKFRNDYLETNLF